MTTHTERTFKGLTKQFIKECQDAELNFSKEELKVIKKTARVVLYNNDYFWELSVRANFTEDTWRAPYLWGHFTWYKKEAKGTMEIRCGQNDTVGSIHRDYNCSRPQGTNYRKEFDTLIEFMKEARKDEVSYTKSYLAYVAATGDMN